MTWVTNIKSLPKSFKSSIGDNTLSVKTGPSKLVGSSKKIILGLIVKAFEILALWACPQETFLGILLIWSSNSSIFKYFKAILYASFFLYF